jgi:hypothetical protein
MFFYVDHKRIVMDDYRVALQRAALHRVWVVAFDDMPVAPGITETLAGSRYHASGRVNAWRATAVLYVPDEERRRDAAAEM